MLKKPTLKVPIVHLQMVKDKEIEYGSQHMNSPEEAADLIRKYLDGADCENLIVCAVDAKGKPALIQTVRVGTVNICCYSIADVFKAAILSNAVGILLFHNHPSGEPEPSKDDIQMTERVKEAGKLLGIKLLDHIIIGEDSFYSFKEQWEYWEQDND